MMFTEVTLLLLLCLDGMASSMPAQPGATDYPANRPTTARPLLPKEEPNVAQFINKRTKWTYNDPYALEAFDCSAPEKTHHVQVKKRDTPCDRPVSARSAENVTYTILQEALRKPLSGFRCELLETRIPVYCGNYDHQTIAMPLATYNRHTMLSVTQCNAIWNDQAVSIPKVDKSFPISRNGTTEIYFEPYGQTYLKSHVECEGVSYSQDGHTMDNMVVGVRQRYTIWAVDLRVTEAGTVTDTSNELQLPCQETARHCVTDEGTYVWDRPNPAQECPLFKTRTSSGLLVTDNRQNQVFMSNDGTMIRLRKEEKILKCGLPVFRTDYARVFLTSDKPAPLFDRDLPSSELSIVTYVNIQDEYLNADIMETFNEELAEKEAIACRARKNEASLDYAQIVSEQRSPQGGESAHIGDGWMVTPAGESWVQFQCRPVIVSAKITTDCFTSLPVTVSPADEQLFRQARNHTLDPNESLDFFVEPHTRRLHVKGVRTACIPDMAPLYESINKRQWIKADPLLKLVQAPQIMAPYAYAADGIEYVEKDFENGGLYSPESVEQMEIYFHSHRVAAALTTDMASSALSNHWQGTDNTGSPWISPSIIGMKIPRPLFDPFSWLAPVLDGYEEFCNIVVMCVITFRIACYLAGCAMRAYAGPPPGIGYPAFLLVVFFKSFQNVLEARLEPRRIRHHKRKDRKFARSRSIRFMDQKVALRKLSFQPHAPARPSPQADQPAAVPSDQAHGQRV